MVLTTGGGYYPFYLFFTALTMLGVALIFVPPGKRIDLLKRSAVIALLAMGLVAVMVLPIYDGYRLIERDVAADFDQMGSQPIHYALINYVVSTPEWFRTTILGTAGGWNWFYIGPLALGSLVFLPLAFRKRKPRAGVWAMLGVLATLLMWHGNRYSLFRYIYEWFPFLYQLRFPNRLLILAASPLLIVSGFSLQGAYTLVAKKLERFKIAVGDNKTRATVSGKWVAVGIAAILLVGSFKDVYEINQGVAMPPSIPLETKAYAALRWLKQHDPGLYYTSIGTFAPFWSWTPVAYDLEMPVYNLIYSQRLKTKNNQTSPSASFSAQPKYLFWQAEESAPEYAQLIGEFDGINLWYFPEVLPFAFLVPVEKIDSGQPITNDDITGVKVSYDGPNHVIVPDVSAGEGQALVVLVSDYPGWRLRVDGKHAALTPTNDYLGAEALPGTHTYTFIFAPTLYFVGLVISLATMVLMVVLVIREKPLNKEDLRLEDVMGEEMRNS
jgi:hypothetical protein